MKRRVFSPNPVAMQTLLNYKQASIDALIAVIPESTTFAELGDLIGSSDEWVAKRIDRSKIFKIGRRYKIPRAAAVEFVRSVYV